MDGRETFVSPDVARMYDRVAELAGKHYREIFKSEDALKQAWEEFLPGVPFERSKNWDIILRRYLDAPWALEGPTVHAPITDFDLKMLLFRLQDHLDFNIWTQVYMNLQPWSMIRYSAGQAAQERTDIAARWAAKRPNPTAPGAAMIKSASTDLDLAYNRDLSILKALAIIESAQTTHVSARVTPMGSTPALADSLNFSQIGVGGDKFLRAAPGGKVFFFRWDDPYPLAFADGKFSAEGIPVPFESKSGGEILGRVLRSRWVAAGAYRRLAPERDTVILPRMASAMVATDDPEAFERLAGFACEHSLALEAGGRR